MIKTTNNISNNVVIMPMLSPRNTMKSLRYPTARPNVLVAPVAEFSLSMNTVKLLVSTVNCCPNVAVVLPKSLSILVFAARIPCMTCWLDILPWLPSSLRRPMGTPRLSATALATGGRPSSMLRSSSPCRLPLLSACPNCCKGPLASCALIPLALMALATSSVASKA